MRGVLAMNHNNHKNHLYNNKTWRVMIYLAGDNNLSGEMIWALKELYRVGIGKHCHVAAQFDPSATNVEPRCYDLDKLHRLGATSCDVDGILDLDSLAQTLATNVIPSPENSADPAVLAGFLNNFLADPTDHAMLILSGHGCGAFGGLLEDRNPYGRLTLPCLGRVLSAAKNLRKTKKIDILGLDSCAMSMVEVAHEVCDSVDYLVGAEGFVQNAGWPYHRLLESLRCGPAPEKLALEMVDNYFKYYSDYLLADVFTDQAVIHIEKDKSWARLIEHLKKLTDLLCKSLGGKKEEMDETVRNALILAHWEAQSFNTEQNVDIYDFCERLSHYLPKKQYRAIHDCCAWITDKRNWNRIVLSTRHSGPAYQFAHGLSIYFPWSEIATDYQNLAFATETGWYDFLIRYIDRTCRDLPPKDRRAGKIRVYNPADIGGYQVYRAGGTMNAGDDVKAGGMNSTKAGGMNSTKYGLTAEEILRLSSMKNFPVHYYEPKPLTDKEVHAEISRRSGEIVSDAIPSSNQHDLLDGLNLLPDNKRKSLVDKLSAPNPPRTMRP